MADTFNCPNCGAALDYKGNDPIIRCPYCNSSVVVPENLRAKPAFSSQPHNFALSGFGDMNELINQARRFKEVKDLAQTGDMDGAVRVYCEITGVSPEMARPTVESLANGQPIMLNGLNTSEGLSSVSMMTGSSFDMGGLIQNAQRFKEVKNLAQAGDMDGAIRVYCEITGASPETARPSVEALANGQPITLSEFNMTGRMPSVSAVTAPAITIKPVDEKTSKGIARSLGCGIGCVVVGIILFVLLTVVAPGLIGLAGVAIGLKPDLVLTAIPNVPGLVGSGYGTKELSFGGEGSGPGLFDDARAISVDPASGKIYVADYQGGRVQEFDAQGKFVTQWVVDGKKPIISSLAADRKGNVYVVASGKLLRYTSEGLSGEIKAGKFNYLDNIALAADGSLVAVDSEDVAHITVDGEILGQIPAAISTVSGDSELNAKVAIDGAGNVFLVGTFNNAVFKFGPDGKFINRFGSQGDQPGQFSAAGAIAVDGKGRVYVSDSKGVQVFSNDGRYINVISVEYYAYGLAFDDQGKLYVTTNQNKVEKYSIPE